MKRGDKKFASNRALYCCSEHFVETDYRKSLTDARRDLVKNAVLSIFTWSDQNEEVSQRSESKNPWGQNDQVIRRSFGYGNRERIWYV